MKRPVLCLLLLGFTSIARADDAALKEARLRYLRGNYEESREQYQKLTKNAELLATAVVGVSRTWQSQGRYDKAIQVVEASLANPPAKVKDDKIQAARLHARRAELLYLQGRWADAMKAADQALVLNKDEFYGHWVRAQVLRDRGDMKDADQECRWFVRTYTQRSFNDNEIKDPDLLLLVGLAGAENARWHNLADQFRFILNDVYADALKFDKTFWPAEYESGVLLLEKYNRAEAVRAFDKALTINPNAAKPLVGKGLAALQKFEISQAERFAERALAINPNLPAALHLLADVHFFGGDVDKAMKELAKARKINPRDEATLGRIAACLVLQKNKQALDALVKEVLKHDPKPGPFYHVLAQRLEDRRRFDEADGYFRQAMAYRPQVPWSRNSLGLLLMRLGNEKEARKVLTKAFAADPFNIRVSNTLKVLRHLDKYETLETEHFAIRFDPQKDGVLGHYVAHEMEKMYEELAKQFQFRPKGPILVEIFNNHQMFSGRVVALPDLHTIGACTGRMMAMVAPGARGVGKKFNWARVVRHELVHIFNLEQTKFQVPHWLTEGLAVANEGFPRPQQWNDLLQQRVPDRLFTLDNVNMGFIRPKSPLEWHLAYCQSNLYVEYIEKTHGPEAIGQLLAAYRDGLGTGQAIQKVCKVNKAELEKGYREYLQQLVDKLGGANKRKTLTLGELREAHAKDPDDHDMAARLAEQYHLRARNTEARKLVEGVLAKKKNHPLACFVKARLLRRAGDEDGARKLLESAAEAKNPGPKVLLDLGKLYYEMKELTKAAEVYERGYKLQPSNNRWLIELARVYGVLGDRKKLIATMKAVAPTEPDDKVIRNRLAQMMLDDGGLADAETYARQVLEIDVLDRDAQKILITALQKQNKAAEVVRLEKVFNQ